MPLREATLTASEQLFLNNNVMRIQRKERERESESERMLLALNHSEFMNAKPACEVLAGICVNKSH